MLDAHQLNVFVTAATTMNFTEAARQLHMSQPSVSQHIRELENYFDVQLFLREGRRIQLTDAGKLLLPLAKEMVTMSVRIEESMQSLKDDVYGHLIVGCSTTCGKYVLPLLLADFLRLYPRVEASCHVTSRSLALQMLDEGQVHLALANACEFCKDVEFYKLLSDPIVLIAPLNHPWAQRRRIALSELVMASFILREEGSGTRAVVKDGLAEHGLSLSMMPTVLTLGNSEAIALAVREGIGVGFVSQTVVDRLVPDQVAVIDVPGLSLHQDIYLGRHKRQPATPAQTAFWNFVCAPDNDWLREFVMNDEHNLQPAVPSAV